MTCTPTAVPDVIVIAPRIFGDDRGFFFESYNQAALASCGITGTFVQDNHSRSAPSVLRGLHYQIRHAQGKLVRVVVGEVFDVAVDLRRNSSTFGKWAGETLSAENKKLLWIPPGFAHGFLVTKGPAEFLYKVTDYWEAASERTIIWNDPDLNIAWPVSGEPILSAKDGQGVRFRDAECFS
jgi:dTDP-4-dehydrorhamnose 3,5-epimerase